MRINHQQRAKQAYERIPVDIKHAPAGLNAKYGPADAKGNRQILGWNSNIACPETVKMWKRARRYFG